MQGHQVRTGRGTDRSATVNVLGMLVLLALMIVLDPEVRVFLLFLDSVTVDIFLLLLAFQGREYLWLLHGAVILPAARHLADLGPYPLPLPSRWFFTQHPFWAVYATAQLMAVASWIAMQAAIVVTAATSTVMWPTGKALSATILAKRQRVGNVLVRRRGAMAL